MHLHLTDTGLVKQALPGLITNIMSHFHLMIYFFLPAYFSSLISILFLFHRANYSKIWKASSESAFFLYSNFEACPGEFLLKWCRVLLSGRNSDLALWFQLIRGKRLWLVSCYLLSHLYFCSSTQVLLVRECTLCKYRSSHSKEVYN